MSAPPVTIGLPVYNGENYLGEAIESLRKQTFSDFLLVISDNASTDSTEELARAAAKEDSRIQYVRQETNMGGPANYNYLLTQASSPYFMWHAHDDLRAPEFLERAYPQIVETPEASVIFSRTMLIGPSGEEKQLKPRPDGFLAGAPHRRLRAAITARHIDVVLFGLTRRKILEQTSLHGSFKGGDRVLVAELALLGRLVELDEPLFFNRDHPDRYTRLIPKDDDEVRIKRAWWDPSTTGKRSMPRWLNLAGYLAAVAKHPLSAGEKVACYGAIAASLFANRMYLSKQLAKEILESAPSIARRAFGFAREPKSSDR